MTKWEYKIWEFGDHKGITRDRLINEDFGNEGWELVAVTPTGFDENGLPIMWNHFFKRPKQN